MRGAPIPPSRFSAFPARPERGGSTTTTPGAPERSSSSSTTSPTLPAKNAAFVIPFTSAFSREDSAVLDPFRPRFLERARDRLLGALDPPHGQRLARHRQADRADAA